MGFWRRNLHPSSLPPCSRVQMSASVPLIVVLRRREIRVRRAGISPRCLDPRHLPTQAVNWLTVGRPLCPASPDTSPLGGEELLPGRPLHPAAPDTSPLRGEE